MSVKQFITNLAGLSLCVVCGIESTVAYAERGGEGRGGGGQCKGEQKESKRGWGKSCQFKFRLAVLKWEPSQGNVPSSDVLRTDFFDKVRNI